MGTSRYTLVAPLLLAGSVTTVAERAPAPSSEAAAPVVHKVEANDTLSQVIEKLFTDRIYGKNGLLARVLRLNPQLGDGHLIRPGQEILLVDGRHVQVTAAEKTKSRRPASIKAKAAAEEAPAECRAPASAEAAAPTASEEADDGTASRLKAELGAEYFRIDAVDRKTGGTASILSQMSPGVRAAWELEWTPEWTSRLGFSYRSVKALDTDDAGKSVLNRDGKLLGFSGAVERRWGERSVSHAFLQRQEELFTRSPSTSSVTLDRLGVFSAGIGHEQTIFRKGRAAAGVGAQAAYLFSGSGPGYSVESGVQGRGSVFMEHRRQSLSLHGEAFYDVRKQNSSISEINQKTVGFYLGLEWLLK